MIWKIISGGQTGVDRAALDVAIQMDISHGGWVPKGRRAEDGVIPDKYDLKEMPTDSYEDRTEQNVTDSDGTLILSRGELTGGSMLTRELAIQHNRPWLHLDLLRSGVFDSAKKVSTWIEQEGIRILNVAGPRASSDPDIYRLARKVLQAVFYLDLVTDHMPDPNRTAPSQPSTADQAVSQILSELSLKDKTEIARMKEEGLASLAASLGEYIGQKFGLGGRNRELINSCTSLAGKEVVDQVEASALIIKELWKKLRQTHLLRIVR